MDLDHLCRVRRCVNPDHLEQVSRSENNRRGLLGNNPINAKLTRRDVKEIRALIAAGEPNGVIATRFGVHQTNISKIRNNRTWKGV
jgi:DNA-binding NarL/FixJ family response regulator